MFIFDFPLEIWSFFIINIRYRVILQKNIAESLEHSCWTDNMHSSRLTADAYVRLTVKTDVQIGRKNAHAVYTCI